MASSWLTTRLIKQQERERQRLRAVPEPAPLVLEVTQGPPQPAPPAADDDEDEEDADAGEEPHAEAEGSESTSKASSRKESKSTKGSRQASRVGSKLIADEVEEDFDPSVVSGVLTALLERAQHAARQSEIRKSGIKKVLVPPQSVGDVVHFLMVLDWDGFKKGNHEHVWELVRNEALFYSMLRPATAELKARGAADGGWPAVAPGTLRDRAAQVCACKRESLYLDAQVHNWLLRDRLLNKHVRHTPEKTFEHRRNRINFWMEFHGCGALEGRPELPRSPCGRGPGGMTKSTSLPTLRSPEQAASPAASRRSSVKGPGNNAEGAAAAYPPSTTSSPRSPLSAEASPGRRASQVLPGSPKSGVKLPSLSGRGRRRYLKECGDQHLLTVPLSFVLGNTTKLDAVGKELTDGELLALGRMLQEKVGIEEVDLSSNTLLTDKALAPFIRQLGEDPNTTKFRRLSLSGCARAGAETISSVVDLLKYCESLRHLDLSHVSIASKSQLQICQGIVEQTYLESVNLADTGLGASPVAIECIKVLLASDSRVKTLDLSWNPLHSDAFIAMGESVAESTSLRSLKLSGSSASTEEPDPPISWFIEFLNRNKSLVNLDISVNRVDVSVALMLEDNLQQHRKLKRLVLEENPLGVLGIRSVLRLLADPKSALMHFATDKCLKGYDKPDQSSQIFSATYPGRQYCLDLARPTHRTVLRLLYKAIERYKLSPDLAFQNPTYSEPEGISLAAKDKVGVWCIPTCGRLEFKFDATPVIEAAAKGVKDDDFAGFLKQYFDATLLQPGIKQAIPLFARWRELFGRRAEQLVYLSALSKDFRLSAPCLEHICRSCPELAEVAVSRLLPCLPGDEASQHLGVSLFRSPGSFIRMRPKMASLLDFCVENPTGHYKLDLGRSCDHAVAQRLLLLDRWESIVDRRAGSPADRSQRGNGSRFRNEHFQGEPMHLIWESVTDWSLHEFDQLEFDYASNRRAPQGAAVLSHPVFTKLLTSLHRSKSSPGSKVGVLHAISRYFYVSCQQLRRMLQLFGDVGDCVGVAVVLFTRIVDLHNVKLWRSRFGELEDFRSLQDRLGYVALFPFIQPESAKFELDLSSFEQRVYLSILRGLEVKERAGHNLCNVKYEETPGFERVLREGVPRSWANEDAVPRIGTFSGSYRCAPSDRSLDSRRELARTHGGFKVDVKEERVNWWTCPGEVPSDVLEFVDFLFGRYCDSGGIDRAFADLEAPEGSGFITLRQFDIGLQELGCTRFKCDSEEEEWNRVSKVFRYLDLAGGGEVSLEHWQVLNSLWKDFDLSVFELVDCLVNEFGGDLQDAWHMLDSAGAGVLTQEAFDSAMKALGFFGSTRPVFSLLDVTETGKISQAQFQALGKHKQPPKEMLK